MCYGSEYQTDFYITQIETHGVYFEQKVSVVLVLQRQKTRFEISKERSTTAHGFYKQG